MNRYDLITGEKTPMRPITGPRENGDTAKAYRFNWNSPLLISRHDPATIYLGGNYLMRSRDRGMSWEEVGGFDLTKQIDRDTLEIMGVSGSEPMMSIHDGISTYGNLTVVSESHDSPDVIWAGTDDGNVQVTVNGGETWTNVVGNIPDLPERTYVSRLATSAHAPGRVYATFDGHRNGDYTPYVYVTEDDGQSWRSIGEGLPDGWSINVITEHHRAEDLLFVGNEIGVYVSIDRGESWARLKGNLPTVPVDDIAIHPRENDLIIGTHGRSAWIMDDISPLEHLAEQNDVLAGSGAVFPMKKTIMWAQKGDWPFYGATYSAPNPPRAVRVRYYLRDDAQGAEATADAEAGTGAGTGSETGAEARAGGEAPEGEPEGAQSAPAADSSSVEASPAEGQPGPSATENGRTAADRESDGPPEIELRIADASGNHVRTLEGPGEAGLHELLWDWRYDAPYEPDGDPPAGGQGGGRFGGSPQGPIVLPGAYTVSLTIGSETHAATVEIEADPRRPMTAADRRTRQAALMALHELAKPLYEATQGADRLADQMSEAASLLESHASAPDWLTAEVDSIQHQLEEISDGLQEARQWSRVAAAIQGSSTVPTEDQLWQVDAAWDAVPPLIGRLNDLISRRVPAFNASLDAEGVRPDPGPEIAVPRRGR
jgi:photosystem II stability/assembly factor-like uncharacterized protein